MSESWIVDGGWACHCGPVPPYPADFPGPCRQCFALVPVKQKADTAQSVREAEAAVIAAALAFESHINDHGWSRGLGYDCTVAISATNGLEASNALTELQRAIDTLRAQEGE